MAADDFLNPPQDQGFPDLDPSSMSGNRPASGSRRATPGEVLSQGFQGAENAGDFLGLDVEFTASQDPNQGYGAQPLDLVPPPGTYSEEQYAEATAQAPAPLPSGDAVQEFAQAPSAFEFGDDLGSDEGDFAVDGGAESSSKKPVLVAALLVAALSASGVLYGPSLYTRYLGGETQVVEDTNAPGWQQKPTRPPSGAANPEPGATEVAKLDPSASAPVVPPESLIPSVPETTTKPQPFVEPEPPAVDPVASTDSPESTSLSSAPSLAALGLRPQPVLFPNLDGSEYQWASEDQLELIWRGSEVPLEALSAPAKTLMPRVGSVRVFTTSGDVFEGRLYAVGQNRVWLDTAPGRVGLDGDKVERIEVLPPQPDGQLAASGEFQVLGAKRVRVRVPGGTLYGSVLKSEGEDVTLALDDGGRVRVKAADVQELGTGRAVVVRR